VRCIQRAASQVATARTATATAVNGGTKGTDQPKFSVLDSTTQASPAPTTAAIASTVRLVRSTLGRGSDITDR
jgi:hypothetical protein